MIEIRKILAADAEKVSGLSVQLGYQTTAEETLARIHNLKKIESNCAFVALVNDEIVGWIHGFYAVRIESEAFVEIGGLIVDLNNRKKNIGRMLINAVLSWAKIYQVQKVKVRCNTIRRESHLFYEKSGFKLIKEQKIFELDIE
ncbi:GNAT family N-acetyltransferase [Pedobacter rhodius]|uniref:GNAT family N-acetyltransferase n=1 Tax=Pedobacter rhodius TaxID=3004098 RepID=A0ABT4L2T1_9SPHI|nr:GNAT family N-acetyltransferase [Pedobacter sp. SJ11]MCZ4225491.1 GNAT family N-acetyltransferase [Pedobacter sp. SJ11]